MTEPPPPTDPPRTDIDPERVVRRMAAAGESDPSTTELDPARTGGESGTWANGAGAVPLAFDDRFTVLRQIGGESGEADLYLVRENGGSEQVLKLYRPKHEPDPRIRELLVDRRISPSLVHITEAGVAGGRHYELMEHLPGGDLDALRAGLDGPPDPALFRAIVEQLAAAIDRLHELGIVHRDVKPGNILLRSQPTERPPSLALIDFGISRRLDGSDIRRTRSGTIAYSSPQALVGIQRPESDWWSLGVVCVELLTGELPYAVNDPNVIIQQVAAGRPVPLDAIADPGPRLLCQGLLVQDPEDRWGYAQIRQWLDGNPPAPPEPPAAPRDEPAEWALPYADNDARTRLELADLLESNWDRAAARFFAVPGSDAWRQLSDWMAQFDDAPDGDPAGRKALTRRAEAKRNREPSYVLLLRLLNWLDPDRHPLYRGRPITPEHLPALAAEAISAEPTGAELIIRDLWEHDLLTLLAACPAGGGLATIAARWRALAAEWAATPRELVKAEVHREPAGSPRVRPYLLWMATGDAAVPEWLDGRLAWISAELEEEVPWFAALAGSSDVMPRLRAVLLEDQARAAARRFALDRAVTAQRLAWERRRDDRIRWHRDQQRMLALGWAAAGAAVVLIAWSWVIGLDARLPLSSPRVVDRAWAYAMLTVVVVLAGEISLALVMGGLYYQYREYALFGSLIQHGNRLLHPFRTNGWAALPIIVPTVAAVALGTIYLPYLLPLLGGLAYVAWAFERHARWNRKWRAPAASGAAPPAGPSATNPPGTNPPGTNPPAPNPPGSDPPAADQPPIAVPPITVGSPADHPRSTV